MPRNARVEVPVEVAEELIAEGVAVRPFGTRGGGVTEVINIAIEAINTGSALVSIGLAAATCRRLAVAMIRRRHPADPNELTITITVGGNTQSLQLDRSKPDAEDKAFDFFVTGLNGE